MVAHFEELGLRDVSFCLGVGGNFDTERIYREATEVLEGAKCPVLLHQSSSVSRTASLSEGAVLMAHASVGAGSSVGIGSILNTGSSSDHEAELGKFASLSPGARTGGRVLVGERVMIGMGATVLQGISIGSDAVIGALSMINREVSELTVAYGNPCRKIRFREADEQYFYTSVIAEKQSRFETGLTGVRMLSPSHAFIELKWNGQKGCGDNAPNCCVSRVK